MRPTLILLYLVWIAWAASWMIAARWTDRTVARPDASREWRYRRFTVPGWILLLGYPVPGLPLIDYGAWEPWWRLPAPLEWALVALATAGCSFAWWARIHLGRLWSVALTRKVGHHIVDSGPYGLVRHPIYTGLCTAALATFAVRASPAVALGLAFFLLGYLLKAREEERFLADELGTEAYERYRRRVPMLIPFLRF